MVMNVQEEIEGQSSYTFRRTLAGMHSPGPTETLTLDFWAPEPRQHICVVLSYPVCHIVSEIISSFPKNLRNKITVPYVTVQLVS